MSGASFWAKRRVLVTGHTGFKGGWLSLWLETLGAQVSGLALAPASPGFFESTGLAKGIASNIGDIRDYAVVDQAVRAARPEVLFHLAAQSLVRASYHDPIGNYATNVMGTAHVLEAARRCPSVRAIIVVTSDKCYENKEWPWGYRENDRLGGHDPYSSSKACAEIVTGAYQKSFFSGARAQDCGVATVRAGNVIGGGDWAEDRLIPDLVRSITDKRAPVLRYPAATRPWQHVLDPLAGYLALAEKLASEDRAAYAGAWNFGPRDADIRDVGWVADRFLAHWGWPGSWVKEATLQPHEAALLRLDASKARSILGWTPAIGLDQALADTVDWYKGALSGKNLRQLSIEQIGRYMSSARDSDARSRETSAS